jgi:arginine/lysine/ornithine decarboxylase
LSELAGGRVLLADLTEVADLDDLQWPCGAIAEAEVLAAEAFGAEETLFLVNGVTAGIHASLLGCAAGGKVAVPRNVHRSVLGGLVLAGADPVYMTPEIDSATGIAGSVSPGELGKTLDGEPGISTVLLVHPTYHGIAGDLRRLVEVSHAHGAAVIVDEAHGSHFGFHDGFPPSAMSCGADISIAGCHKTFGALTQAAILNLQGSFVDREKVRACARAVQTTSPSYLLMASLDSARRLMATRGRSLLENALRLGAWLRQRVNETGVFRSPGPEWTGKPGFFELDPTKVTVLCRPPMDGRAIERQLRSDFGLVVELAHRGHMLAVVTYADEGDTVGKLAGALRAIAAAATPVRSRASGDVEGRGGVYGAFGRIPRKEMSLREAFLSVSRWVGLSEARGCVSADVVAAYPPGIPVLCPGELIDDEAVELIRECRSAGNHFHGLREDREDVLVRVVLRDGRDPK